MAGVKFWKTPSRKIFAVNKRELRGQTMFVQSTMMNSQDSTGIITQSSPELQEVLEEVKGMKKGIEGMQLAIWANSGAIPATFKAGAEDAFRCKICQTTPCMPPVILARCCTNIIGCQPCVDKVVCRGRWAEQKLSHLSTRAGVRTDSKATWTGRVHRRSTKTCKRSS